MGTLNLIKFKCNETTEATTDSPYFVFFIGEGSEPSAARLVRLRLSQWDDNVKTGQLWETNVGVASNIDTNTLILCALMEEDDSADIGTGNGAFMKIRQHMRTLFEAFAASGSASLGQLALKLIPEFRKAIDDNTTNDDIVDVALIPANKDLTQRGPFVFAGDGGKYSVSFKIS